MTSVIWEALDAVTELRLPIIECCKFPLPESVEPSNKTELDMFMPETLTPGPMLEYGPIVQFLRTADEEIAHGSIIVTSDEN